MIRSTIYLIVAAAIAAALISVSERSTHEQRQKNQRLYATRMLNEVLPAGSYDQPPGVREFQLSSAELLGSDAALPAYPVYRNGVMVAVVISAVAPQGYVGPIPLLIGIDRDGRIVAVRATGHRETPGLGDKIDIDNSDWILQFTGKQLTPPSQWALKNDGGDFDQISGATITSRAVIHAVQNALQYYMKNQPELTAPVDN